MKTRNTELDWKKLGLKVGLEIHQQLDTHKLFCECPSILREDKPDKIITRRLRAVAGEMGEIDIAAREEELKKKIFVYEAYSDTTCLVELDEEPPHPVNEEALKIAIQIAKLLNMKILDELVVMRKVVIDGSNVSGFQRTMLIGIDGWVDCSFGRVKIPLLALEEEAARKIRESGDKVVFRLDRLGIPLVEIRTEPDMHTPNEVKECAERIGLLLRMTGKVKRGIGTIRQDVNISIKGGARIEIKGVQDLRHLPKIVENEALRQKNLLELHKKFKNLVKKFKYKVFDVSEAFEGTKSKLIANSLEKGARVLCIKLPKFKGYFKFELQPNRTFSKELLDFLKVFSKVKGFIHSDELPGYGITESEVKKIRELINAKEGDGFLFVVAEESEAENALRLLWNRLTELLSKGVVEEVRGVNEDLTTRFTRRLPGASRMYPETDLLPVKVSRELVRKIKVPEKPEEKVKKFVRKFKLSEELANQIVRSEKLELFEELAQKYKKVKASLIAKLLFNLPQVLKKRGVEVKRIGREEIEEFLELLSKGKVIFESSEFIFEKVIKEGKRVEDVINELGLWKLSEKEVLRKVGEIVKSKGLRSLPFEKALGIVMKELRGRSDFNTIKKCLRKVLKEK